MNIQKSTFRTTFDGKNVELFALKNRNGLVLNVTNFGVIVVTLNVPDKNGKIDDIVLGYDSLQEYIDDKLYFGCVVGRYANRIVQGTFRLNGTEYHLNSNNGKHHLHGGPKGFHKQVWAPEQVSETELHLNYLSRDGKEGYPGNLQCEVIYSLTDKNEFCIDYQAVTDKMTPVNLSHHSYFNLAGQGNGRILNHMIRINAEHYTEVSDESIPSGNILSVADSPMDLREMSSIGPKIKQMRSGYDHNYIINSSASGLVLAASASESISGRWMDVYTTQPGIQFYSGNYISPKVYGKSNRTYGKHSGFCLETQHFPDSPNHTQFPNTILYPGKIYSHKTVYVFSVN